MRNLEISLLYVVKNFSFFLLWFVSACEIQSIFEYIFSKKKPESLKYFL